MNGLNVLLIDDDPESLELLRQSLPDSLAGRKIRWEPCGDFDQALQQITDRRFDIVVTDIYRDRTSKPKDPVTGDPRGGGILNDIRQRRFCPVLMFTDEVFPPDYKEGPFLKLADKSPGDAEIVAKLAELIETGVPELAHRLHDDLDKTNGSYLWEFLDSNWADLDNAGLTTPTVLERLIRRRASVQLARLEDSHGGTEERRGVEGAEFYLQPGISADLRLGEIVCRDGEYRLVLTPHCHLVVQPGKEKPSADFV